MGFGEGLNSLLEPSFLCGDGLFLVPQALKQELPLTFCVEEDITLMSSGFQSTIGRLEVVLKLLPGRGIVVIAAVALCFIQLCEFRLQWFEFCIDDLQPLPLRGLLVLKTRQPFRPLAVALKQWAMVSLRRVALSDQAGLALFHLPQLWFLLLEQLRQFGLFAPAGCQGLPDL